MRPKRDYDLHKLNRDIINVCVAWNKRVSLILSPLLETKSIFQFIDMSYHIPYHVLSCAFILFSVFIILFVTM